MNTSTKPTECGNKSKPLLFSRLFRFRAWVRNELMVNVISIDFNNEFITWDDNQYDRCVPPNKYYEIETFNDIVLMQYTNLNDREGQEIYEGDIVEWIGFSEIEKMQVYWRNGAWYFNRFECNNVDWNSVDTTKIKVIGNIFENPELL